MAYCKTKTYINLKRIADRAYMLYVNNPCDATEDHFLELEIECADYAIENEDEINWDEVDG